jgi:hypothetical protein
MTGGLLCGEADEETHTGSTGFISVSLLGQENWEKLQNFGLLYCPDIKTGIAARDIN